MERGERNTLQTVREVRCPLEATDTRRGVGAYGADSEQPQGLGTGRHHRGP